MLYSKFILKAKELTVQQADNGLWYLEPEWQSILCANSLDNFRSVDANYIKDWASVGDILKLEVEKRNTIASKKPTVEAWLYDLITATVEPAMLQEETEYIKQVMEFMKANHQKEDKENETEA